MPSDRLGQQITFASEVDPDERYANFVYVRVTAAQRTIWKIVTSRGQPGLALQVAQMNGIRSITQKLKLGRRIRLPGTVEQKLAFSVHPQDGRRPIIKDGYAMFEQTARYGEKSITHFLGYNALAMDVPIWFEGWVGQQGDSGSLIETKIKTLERMAGRGPGFPGAASGPPAIVRVSVTDNYGDVVPLIPFSFQWSPESTSAGILWRIEGIDWDDNALSDESGNRIRATAVVHLREHTAITLNTTAAQRTKQLVDQRLDQVGAAGLGRVGSLG